MKTIFSLLLTLSFLVCNNEQSCLALDISICCVDWTRSCSDPAVPDPCAGACNFANVGDPCGHEVQFLPLTSYFWIKLPPVGDSGQWSRPSAKKLCGTMKYCICTRDGVGGFNCQTVLAGALPWMNSQYTATNGPCIGGDSEP